MPVVHVSWSPFFSVCSAERNLCNNNIVPMIPFDGYVTCLNGGCSIETIIYSLRF